MAKTKEKKPAEKGISLHDEMMTEFDNKMDGFMQTSVPAVQIECLEKVESVIEMLDVGQNKKGFDSWGGDDLVRAREKLSRLSETIGDSISIHETASDFAWVWRKGSYASDWLPMKTKLSKELEGGKASINDIESVLTEKYMETQLYSMFHRRRADFLNRKMDAIDRMIRSIDSRLRELKRQWDLPQNQNS